MGGKPYNYMLVADCLTYFILGENKDDQWDTSVFWVKIIRDFHISKICDILPLLEKSYKIKDTESNKTSQYFPHLLLIKHAVLFSGLYILYLIA